MTHKAPADRTLRVDMLARVEGEGAMFVEVRDGRVTDVQLRIYEPPRFFEAFLRGRRYTEPPDITARICGICPVAYQMSACRALENACGVDVTGPLRDLRHLLYCGEWIGSHALHVYMLHAPDFLGYESAIELARVNREVVERGLALKKLGNRIIELVGGRAIHPVNVRLGGFYRVPTKRELGGLRDGVSGPAIPRSRRSSGSRRSTSLSSTTSTNSSRCDIPTNTRSSTAGSSRAAVSTSARQEFLDVVREEQVPHSTALHARARRGAHYLVGPLARYSLNSDRSSPIARDAAARDAGLGPECRNPFQSIVVRASRSLHACDVALRIIDEYEQPDRPAVDVAARGGDRSRHHRGAAGHPLPPVPLDADGTIVDAGDRSADLAEPADHRARPAGTSSRTISTSTTPSWVGAASRRSATTTRASRARPTSSTSSWTAHDPGRRHRGRQPVPA